MGTRRRRIKNRMYMAVTPDEYELPLFVTPYLEEMADRFGKSKAVVASSICHNRQGSKKGGVKFVAIEIDDDDKEIWEEGEQE